MNTSPDLAVNKLLGEFTPNPNLIDEEHTRKVIKSFPKKLVMPHYVKLLADDKCRHTLRHILDKDMEGYTLNCIVYMIQNDMPLKPIKCSICGEIKHRIEKTYCSKECRNKGQSQKIKNKWDTGEFHHQDKIAAVAPANGAKLYEKYSEEFLHELAVRRGKNAWKNTPNDGSEKSENSRKNIRIIHITHPGVREVRRNNMIEANQEMNDFKKHHKNMTESEFELYEILKQFFPSVVFNSSKFIQMERDELGKIKKSSVLYRPDYLIDEKKLIIELDGSYHEFRRDKDRERDEYFSSIGYRTIRIPKEEMYNINYKELLKEYLDD